MTPQTPPTDRPLTADDVLLLREGDLLRVVDPHPFCHAVGDIVTVVRTVPISSTEEWVRIMWKGSEVDQYPHRFTFLARPAASEGEGVAKIVSDEEVARVHGNANFGAISPREVVNEGVRKTAVGYHCGSTMLSILREHGLITKPRPGTSDCDLTKKGKAYGRALWPALASPPVSEREGELEGLFATLRENSWDLRCINLPTGGDDCDIGWRVIGHWQAEPCERTIAEVYHDDPIAAVRAALTAQPAGEGK